MLHFSCKLKDIITKSMNIPVEAMVSGIGNGTYLKIFSLLSASIWLKKLALHIMSTAEPRTS